MSKNNKEFQEFLRDEVNINPSRLDRLHTSRRSRKRLPQRQY